MNGFLPLIEAFLAFALTMLALATAVSALVGVWMRLFRWRALGLRQGLEVVFANEIAPRLQHDAGLPAGEPDRLGFLVDMSGGLDIDAEVERGRLREARIDELRAVRRLAGAGAFVRLLTYPLFRLRRWHSLRFGVDELGASNFALRLDASQAGAALARHYGESHWGSVRAFLGRYFDEVGATATEAFSRRARVRTVIAALLLAVGINVDAFDLLNTYMTDRDIRRGIIAQQERLLAQEASGEMPAVETEPGPVGASATGDRVRGLDRTMARIREQIDALAPVAELDPAAAERLAQLQDLVDGLRGDIEVAAGGADQVRAAVSTTRSIAAQLTQSFPVGWDGYPNCYSGDIDARCALARSRLLGDGLPTADDNDAGFVDRLALIAAQDTAGFVKWLLGVLLSGFMVGLGAPFWVQTVNRALRLKDRVWGGADRSGNNDAVPATSVAPTPPSGRVATGLPPASTPGAAAAGAARGRRARDVADALLDRAGPSGMRER